MITFSTQINGRQVNCDLHQVIISSTLHTSFASLRHMFIIWKCFEGAIKYLAVCIYDKCLSTLFVANDPTFKAAFVFMSVLPGCRLFDRGQTFGSALPFPECNQRSICGETRWNIPIYAQSDSSISAYVFSKSDRTKISNVLMKIFKPFQWSDLDID